MSDVASVVTDNSRGMKRAVEHLANLGHTTITYLAGPDASWANGVRWQAVREATHELGLRARQFGPFPPTQAGGLSAARAIADSPGTAVIAYNDLIAIGLMRGLVNLGIRVPDDVSVVGFDNIFGADFCTPQLTTVAAPLRQLGSVAVQTLLNELRGPGGGRRDAPRGPLKTALLPAQLVERMSTGSANPLSNWMTRA
jgi:LacI family transcriptional regulator